MKNAEVEARNLREEVNRLKWKIEVVRNEVSFRPKNRAKGGRSRNGIEKVRLNNVRDKTEEGTSIQCEWIKVKRGRSK